MIAEACRLSQSGTHDVLPLQQPQGLPRLDSNNNSRGKHQNDMQRMRAATGYSAPIPRLPVQPCRGSQRPTFSGMAVYNCAIAPNCGQYPSSQPSRTIVRVSPPKYVALQLHFRHAIQVLSLAGDGCRFLGLPPPLHDMLLTGVRSAAPSSQRLLSIGSDGSTSGPLSAARLLAPAARACISVKRRINPSN